MMKIKEKTKIPCSTVKSVKTDKNLFVEISWVTSFIAKNLGSDTFHKLSWSPTN